MYGVIIEEGPQDWQIIQQRDGFARIRLAGRVEVPDVGADQQPLVMLRTVDEADGTRVIPPVFVPPAGGRWEAELRLPAGGPYTIESCLRYDPVQEKRGDRLFHIGVGNVYVIAGQSNAMGVGKDLADDPPALGVHMFRTQGRWDLAAHPLHDGTGTRFPASLERVQTGHSPWLSFAKRLRRVLGYPIGLIPAAMGGVPLSAWDRAEDGRLFDNMREMVAAAGTQVKGILWIQGCSDTHGDPARSRYFERFRRVCADLGTVFYEGIPILTAQLNKITCTKDVDVVQYGRNWAALREQQRRAMNELPQVYMIPTIDLPVCDGIHNGVCSNIVIGERMANLALGKVYGRDVVCEAPNLQWAVQEGDTGVRLWFRNVYDRLFADCNRVETQMFTVWDDEGTVGLVDYLCPGDRTIRLTLERPLGKHARVGCRGYNETGLMPYDLYSYLPVIPFDDVAVEPDPARDDRVEDAGVGCR